MNVSDNYRGNWESYWSETSDAPGEAIWDSDPSLTAEPHSTLLLPHADPARPIVDLGCGNGTQTRYLATRFVRAIGVDLSHAAVEHARRAAGDAPVEFEQLDLTDSDGVKALHDRLGDCNVYMRAVIHQSEPAARPAVAAAVATLIGSAGRAFVVELTPPPATSWGAPPRSRPARRPSSSASSITTSSPPTPTRARSRACSARPA